MRFEFATATRIIFGEGTLPEVGPIAASMGIHALVITGSTPQRAGRVLDALSANSVAYTTFPTDGEPTVEQIRMGVDIARKSTVDLVISFGGGSVLDAGKAVAALVTNHGDVLDYLEVIGNAQPLGAVPLPFIAIPTTAGTGSEVTRNAVLASPEHQVKVSLRHPLMLPRIALVDPELTYDLPPNLTASTGMDALTQVIEPFVCNAPNPLVDAICRDGMLRARALQTAYEHPHHATAREDMALASLMGGLALANAKLGAVHGFAGPLGGMYPIPHGVACARLLPIVMDINVRALQQRLPGHVALRRYDEAAHILTGRRDAHAMDGVTYVVELCAALNIPSLSDYGVVHADIPTIVEKSAQASSMKGNPIPLLPDEMAEVLERAL